MAAPEKVDYLYSDMGVVNCVKRELGTTAASAVAVGFYLNEINRYSYWKESAYYLNFKPQTYTTPKGKTKVSAYGFYDYCKDEFHFSRRSVDRFINIFFAFALENKSGGRTKFIDPKYADYNAAQLAEMLSLNDQQLQKVTPDMSREEIRGLKKESEGIAPEDVNIQNDARIDDKIYKNRRYSACEVEYDKFVSSPSMYSQQYFKLLDYLNQGYLVRMILYRPEPDGEERKK